MAQRTGGLAPGQGSTDRLKSLGNAGCSARHRTGAMVEYARSGNHGADAAGAGGVTAGSTGPQPLSIDGQPPE